MVANSPGDLRKKITINSEPVVELDYSGFVARSIYHQRGISYVDDPYEVTELAAYAEEMGFRRDYFRESVKTLVIALLNGEGEASHPEMVKLDQSFLPRFTRPEVEALLSAKHPILAELFRTGEGKRNQRLDSDIALEIITNLRNKDILALPIHDSFVVTHSHRAELESEMKRAYHCRLGFHPVIKEG